MADKKRVDEIKAQDLTSRIYGGQTAGYFADLLSYINQLEAELAACREALDFAVHRQEIGETDWLSDAKQTLSNIQKETPHGR